MALEVVQKLNLRKVGETDVQTQAGPVSLSVYRVDFYIEDLGRIQVLNALGSPWISSLRLTALLGRDSLRDTVFTYEGTTGRYRLRIPGR